MGKFTFDRQKAESYIRAKAANGVNATAEEVFNLAVELAPTRKRGRRKPHASVVGTARTQHFARVRRQKPISYNSSELFRAFERIGGSQGEGGINRAEFRTLKIAAPKRRAIDSEKFDIRSGKADASGTVQRKNKSGKTRGVTRGDEAGGFLKDNIRLIEATIEGNVVTATVRSEAPYSRYVEFPTRRTAAQPFLLPAFKVGRSRLKTNIKAAKGT